MSFDTSLNGEATADLIPVSLADKTEADKSVEVIQPSNGVDDAKAFVITKVDVAGKPEIDLAKEALDGFTELVGSVNPEGTTTVRNLDEVVSTVLAGESIGQMAAQELRKLNPERFDDKFSLKEFTDIPSTVNLNEAKKYAEGFREEKTEALRSKYLQAADCIAKSISCMLEHSPSLVDGVIEIYSRLQSKAFSQLNDFKIPYIFTIVCDRSPYDLRVCSLTCPGDRKMDYAVKALPNQHLRSAVKNLSRDLPLLTAFYDAYHDLDAESLSKMLNSPLQQGLLSAIRREDGLKGPQSQQELLVFLSAGRVGPLVEEVIPKMLEELNVEWRSLKEAGLGCIDNLMAAYGVAVKVVNEVTQIHQFLTEVLTGAALFELTVKDFQDFIDANKK